jgi:hypothetical protein
LTVSRAVNDFSIIRRDDRKNAGRMNHPALMKIGRRPKPATR